MRDCLRCFFTVTRDTATISVVKNTRDTAKIFKTKYSVLHRPCFYFKYITEKYSVSQSICFYVMSIMEVIR